MIDVSKAMRVKKFASKTLLSRDDRAYLARIRRMTKLHVDRVTKTPELAFQELVDAGIYQPDGQLCKQYR